MAILPARIPGTDQPTFVNKNAGVGYVLGGIAGLVVGAGVFIANGGGSLLSQLAPILANGSAEALAGAASTLAPFALPAILAAGASTVIGAAWGAIAGKRQMERELTEGAEVSPPSFWNKNVLAGLALAGVALTTLDLGTILLNSPITPIWDAVITIGTSLLGAVAGGIYGKQQMEERVAQAQQLAVSNERGITQGLGLDRSPALSHQITPEEQALLNARLREGKAHAGHAAMLQERSAAEDSVALARSALGIVDNLAR